MQKAETNTNFKSGCCNCVIALQQTFFTVTAISIFAIVIIYFRKIALQTKCEPLPVYFLLH